MSSLDRLLDAGEDKEDNNLNKADNGIEEQSQRRSTLYKHLSISLVITATIVSISIIWITFRNRDLICGTQSLQQSRSKQLCNCGTSAEAAIANGCRFDPYSATWLPDSCWDEELFQTFESLKEEQLHDFSLYTWSRPLQPLTFEEAGQRAGDPWNITDNRIRTSQSWHYAHCLYVLLKHFRSETIDIGMSERYLSLEHAEHCTTTLMELIAKDPNGHAKTGVSAVYVYND